MVTDRIVRHEGLLPVDHNFNKICDITGYFFKIKTREIRNFVLLAVKKKSHLTARVMARILLNCPIKAEIRAVDSQSDLTILL